MSFTSPDLVRAHIANATFGSAPLRDVRVILSGALPEQLPHAGIVAGSVIVKAMRSHLPTRESRTLSSGWVILNHAQLIERSVVVADNTSANTVYTENIDYIVDYAGGRARRIESGAIAAGASVVVWYGFYHVYGEGDDYAIDYSTGALTRRASGLIADGQEVLVDYEVSLGSVSDAVIEKAIAESGEAVLMLTNEVHHDAPAPGLVIGATHMAVAQVARMRAAAILGDAAIRAAVARPAAQLWLEIAAQYDRSARAFLARFANPIASRSPLKHA